MNEKPLFRSFRDSFDKEIYVPQGGLVTPPVVTAMIGDAAGLARLSAERPPQNAIFTVDAALNVTDGHGAPFATLREALGACPRTVPIFYLTDKNAIAPLAAFLECNRVADALLCAAYDDRVVLRDAAQAMPLLRGLLDCRAAALPADPAALAPVLISHGATGAILPPAYCTRAAMAALQRRLMRVLCEDTAGVAETAALGINGALTENEAGWYAFFAKFPPNSFLRTHKLIAHKGFQNGETFSENTISAVTAAGRYGFDAAEIDVKLTADGVPIVMHNLTTKGLFDGEERVIEQSDFETLAPLRRTRFPAEGIDRFDDLMVAMKRYPETPVLIEIKPRADAHRVEELTARIGEVLSRADVQQYPIGIMGALMPGLAFVHEKLPTLPLAHCEGGKTLPPPPQNRAEAEERLWRAAYLARGCAAGYNPEDILLDRLFAEYANVRQLTVFPWSRSWTFAPSRWEDNGPACDKTFLSGYDAWTTDHGDMYLHLPVTLEAEADVLTVPSGTPFVPYGINRYRDGRTERVKTDLLLLEGALERTSDGTFFARGKGEARAMLAEKLPLHFGDAYCIFSRPVKLFFS